MAAIDEVMTRELATLHPRLTLRDALDVLRGEEVSGAPVVANGEVVGVVSVTDILEFEVTSPGVPARRREQTEWGEFETPDVWREGEDAPSAYFVDFWADAGAGVFARFETTDAPEWDQYENHVVAEIMTRKVVAVKPGTEIREVARVMVAGAIHRVLVMEDGELHGLVSSMDVVRAVADGIV